MKAVTLLSKYHGTLLGCAVGDALGAPFEGRVDIPRQSLDALLSDPHELRYTDDTHMTIGLAECLLQQRGFDGAHMARLFAENYLHEPWRGYGAGPPQIFRQILKGAEWNVPARQLFGGSGSFGNGAAMRVAPVGLFAYRDIDQVVELARQTARVTHAHELGIEGAVVQACAVAFLLESDPDDALSPAGLLDSLRTRVVSTAYHTALEAVEQLFPDATSEIVAREIGNDITAAAAVPAALCCFLRFPRSFTGAVLFAISLGGDTDTIAAMTGALSGAYLGENAIPDVWREQVEGATELRRLGRGLHELATTQ